MSSFSSLPLVLVTGGSGFVSSHIIKLLLQSGQYRIRTTFRNPDEPKSLEVLKAIEEAASKENPEGASRQFVPIERVSADLEKSSDSDWDSVVSGCSFVIHTTSPISLQKVKDEEKFFVGPAKRGALAVLRAARRQGVRRFVFTSSMAAVVYGNSSTRAKDFIYDETVWTAEGKVSGYIKSKAVAERAIWEDWQRLTIEERERFQLVSLNPSYIQGPLIHNRPTASHELILRALTGGLPFVPNAGINFVDVRNVAFAHVAALSAPAELVNG